MLKRLFLPFARLLDPVTYLPRTTVGLLLLAGLLILRIPFLTVVATLFSSTPWWAYFTFCIGTYLLTALLIYWERERLQVFWFDLASAIVFLCQMFMFPVGIGLFAAMRRKQVRFPSPPSSLLRWALFGGLLGILSEIAMVLLQLNPPQERGAQTASLVFLLTAIPIQMVNAAVWEEPLFRGFLWGYLRLAGWKNLWIWLFQAGLFTLSHVYYLRVEPVGQWLVRMLVPALLLGLVAWRARSIAASMVTHGFINATGDLLMHTGTQAQALQVAWSAAVIVAALLLVVLMFEQFRRRKAGVTVGV